MRRRALLTSLLLVSGMAAVTTAQAGAPSRPLPRVGTIVDPRGDWEVGGEDVVRVTVQGRARVLTVDVELAEAIPTQPSHYAVTFQDGCHPVQLTVNTRQGQPVADPALPADVSVHENFYAIYDCTSGALGQQTQLDARYDLPTVRGSHLIWTVPYLKGMSRADVLSQLTVYTGSYAYSPLTVTIGGSRFGKSLGDTGTSSKSFVLG